MKVFYRQTRYPFDDYFVFDYIKAVLLFVSCCLLSSFVGYAPDLGFWFLSSWFLGYPQFELDKIKTVKLKSVA